jgi:tRNA nucleotidyltransferase (CCA-adding enzyme)
MLTGGTVRDLLLNKACQDIDLIAALSPAELTGLGFRLVEASSSASIYFTFHPEFGKVEVTRITSMADLDDDLLRRDFTINAMAMTLSGDLIDPLHGKNDLAHGILRTCSSGSFAGDPLRVFRAFRFEAGGWQMAPKTEELIRRENWTEAFSAMPVERFAGELQKALSGTQPERFFQRMIEFNTGAEVLPELFRMQSIPAGPLQHHPEGDLFTHSVQVLQRVAAISSDPLARFCAFFHDIGKLATDPALYPKHHGHDYAGFGMAVSFCNRLHLSGEYRTALAWISSLHGKANLWATLRDSTKLTMAEQARKAGIVEILPLVSGADKAGNAPMTGWDEAVRIAEMNTRELGIDQEKLEAMPVKNRAAYILQKRIGVLKNKRLNIC